ncbi:hypothetical protein SAMN04488066_1363 [Halorubrum aquaticum]|uniref:Uncharacterized protein n=1 Tax=Halorubrum aquaticum TaxID=387340 RepID=A0A1I3CYE7_9EURY|nr:hypothetical protein [Halorubrum aquaticum]SFH79447.1 hypothetical protein SAMN04488066_1363 [Halorubrum aquaticum]
MSRALLPAAVAAVAAGTTSVTRRIAPILLESSIDLPSTSALSLYIAGGRFVSFALVYGLLLGVAYGIGRAGNGSRGDGSIALATGVIAAVTYLVVTAGTLHWLGPQQGAITAVMAVGSSVGVGVQLAVVAFAGLALGRSRRPATDADEP